MNYAIMHNNTCRAVDDKSSLLPHSRTRAQACTQAYTQACSNSQQLGAFFSSSPSSCVLVLAIPGVPGGPGSGSGDWSVLTGVAEGTVEDNGNLCDVNPHHHIQQRKLV